MDLVLGCKTPLNDCISATGNGATDPEQVGSETLGELQGQVSRIGVMLRGAGGPAGKEDTCRPSVSPLMSLCIGKSAEVMCLLQVGPHGTWQLRVRSLSRGLSLMSLGLQSGFFPTVCGG